MLAIRLPPDMESRLDAVAKTTGRTKTFYARDAILAYLDNFQICICQSVSLKRSVRVNQRQRLY